MVQARLIRYVNYYTTTLLCCFLTVLSHLHWWSKEESNLQNLLGHSDALPLSYWILKLKMADRWPQRSRCLLRGSSVGDPIVQGGFDPPTLILSELRSTNWATGLFVWLLLPMTKPLVTAQNSLTSCLGLVPLPGIEPGIRGWKPLVFPTIP